MSTTTSAVRAGSTVRPCGIAASSTGRTGRGARVMSTRDLLTRHWLPGRVPSGTSLASFIVSAPSFPSPRALAPRVPRDPAPECAIADDDPPVREQPLEPRPPAAGHRSDRRVVQAEVSLLVERVHRDVGREARCDAADAVEAEHACAAAGAPVHHVLDGRGGGARPCPFHEPRHVRLRDHVGGFVRRRAVDAQRDHRAAVGELADRRDPAAQTAVRLGAVRDAGPGLAGKADLVRGEMDHVREPDVRSDPFVPRREPERRRAVDLAAVGHVGRGLGEMRVQPQAERAPGARELAELVGLHRPDRHGRRHDHAPHRAGAGS